jgi:hypothetical protein
MSATTFFSGQGTGDHAKRLQLAFFPLGATAAASVVNRHWPCEVKAGSE